MKRKMKRLGWLTALLLVVALAVPASAATWRGYGSTRANAGWSTFVSTGAPNVEDIQLGIYTYGKGRTVEWNGDWYCLKGSSTRSRSKSGTVTTRARTWKWINLRSSSTRMDECAFSGGAQPTSFTGSHKIRLRVR